MSIKKSVSFLVLIVLCICGIFFFENQKYLIISLSLSLVSLYFFSLWTEKKSFGERRIAVSAVMTALSVAGRFIPVIKPVTSLVIISGMCLGCETGVITGIMTAFVSNFYFGHGPWTSFQMLAWGFIGFMSGVLSEFIRKNRYVLLGYGLLCGIAYSFIMDIWTVLWYNGSFDLKLYLSALVSAVPYTISYAVSNVIYLYFLSGAFVKKLNRLITKYRI